MHPTHILLTLMPLWPRVVYFIGDGVMVLGYAFCGAGAAAQLRLRCAGIAGHAGPERERYRKKFTERIFF